jgi:hypothetical protein
MARNQGSSMQNGSKLGHLKYENGPEKSTWKMGNKVREVQSHLNKYGL